MSSERSTNISLLGRELGQFLLISALTFAMVRLIEHFWPDALVMIAGSAVIVVAMLLVKRDLAVTVTGLLLGVLGPFGEMALVDAGALTYAQHHIEGVPAWLFLVWCAGGIFVASLFAFIRVLIAQTEIPHIDGGA